MSIQRIDDRDPAIVYSPGWERGGTINEYNATFTWAGYQGQTATLTFRGISVSVYGTIRASSPGIPPPQSSYIIDGGTPTIYKEIEDGDNHYNQQFYQSPVLSNGQHTLVVTNLLNNTAAYILDYFIVVSADTGPLPPPVTPKSSTTTSTPTTTSSAVSSSGSMRLDNISTTTNRTPSISTLTVIPSTPVNSLTSTAASSMASGSGVFNSNQTSSTSNQNRIAIIFGVVGGIVALIVVVIYFWKRRRQKPIRRDILDPSADSPASPTGIGRSDSVIRTPHKLQSGPYTVQWQPTLVPISNSTGTTEQSQVRGAQLQRPTDRPINFNAASFFDDAPPSYNNFPIRTQKGQASYRNSNIV